MSPAHHWPPASHGQAEACAWAVAAGVPLVAVGGRQFAVRPMTWGALRSVSGALASIRLGDGLAIDDEHANDCIGFVVAAGFGLSIAELQSLPATQMQVWGAFKALMDASAMESSDDNPVPTSQTAKSAPVMLTPTEQWDRLYADVAHLTGWTWEQLDAMTFPRLRALHKAWAAVPPVPLALARISRYLGLSDQQAKSAGAQSEPQSSASSILAAFGAQGMPILSARPVDPALDAAGF